MRGMRGCENMLPPTTTVIPAHAGIQFVGLNALKNNQINNLDSRMRGNDSGVFRWLEFIHDI
jgi:hypothetical protein